MDYYGPFAALQSDLREGRSFSHRVKALLDSVPDDAVLTVVDCHT